MLSSSDTSRLEDFMMDDGTTFASFGRAKMDFGGCLLIVWSLILEVISRQATWSREEEWWSLVNAKTYPQETPVDFNIHKALWEGSVEWIYGTSLCLLSTWFCTCPKRVAWELVMYFSGWILRPSIMVTSYWRILPRARAPRQNIDLKKKLWFSLCLLPACFSIRLLYSKQDLTLTKSCFS